MPWRGEVEDGIGHDGLAPPSKAQQRRNEAIESEIALALAAAHFLESGGFTEPMKEPTAALLRRMATRLGELLR